MLTAVAVGVLVSQSAFCRSNAVVVLDGGHGALVVDAGVHESELKALAQELADRGRTIVLGFSTHPHWDHLLWHPALGDVRRVATALCASTARERLAGGIDARRLGIPDEVNVDHLGGIEGLPVDADRLPWDGPEVRIVEHRAHAPGHAALLIAEAGVLVAGDMLSDVLIPMPDLNGPPDPIGDYLAALALLEGAARGAGTVIPGHGSVARAEEATERIARDRAYLQALLDHDDPDDPRLGPSAPAGWEWVGDLHVAQRDRLVGLGTRYRDGDHGVPG